MNWIYLVKSFLLYLKETSLYKPNLDDFEKISMVIEQNTSLTKLVISDITKITTQISYVEILSKLLNSLKKNTSITNLEMEDALLNISMKNKHKFIKMLSEIISLNSTIRVLNLNGKYLF
jgi:hypothetical protein